MRIESYAVLSITLMRAWERYWKLFLVLLLFVIVTTILTKSIIAILVGTFIFWLAQLICVAFMPVDPKEIDRYLR